MTKIEEIAALLIDEIQSFEKAVATLQIESEKIKTTKFKVDTTPLNLKFSELLNSLDVSFKNQNTQLNTLQNKLTKTVIIPKWMTILVSSFFIFCFLSFLVNFYQYQKIKEVENTAYDKGIIEITNHMKMFFNDNPRSYKTYQKWKNKK
ncbi:hypothetical protein OD91_2236 [Lutibacter sp. Hel_I_33_5]|uniref:DUF6730 family protein n=1 Tax=Lutibacter sp. Hel_I_33_5 TaxID=1566289 RepID=UPI0011A56694|nr:DUF6730 family protein [Lutibacter sp. Hel_I_33_5]TVZ56934.1 hypothetical protein OD91_2236 [Lutibacter sp. Hel_I_33_5]